MGNNVSIRLAVISFNLVSATVGMSQAGRPGQASAYSPDTIIVKLREGVSAVPLDSRDDALAGRDVRSLSPFDAIHPANRAASARPLFRAFTDNRREMKALLAGERAARTARDRRLLRRAQRMPQGVAAPDLGRIYRVRVDLGPGESLLDVVAAYNRSPYVEYAEPDYGVQLCLVPNDPSYPQQWPLKKISAPQAWDLQTGDPNVVVAVIDTGVMRDHPDLQGNLWLNEIELQGQEGVDDDGNGYIDDIYGYDFAYEDGDPLDDWTYWMALGHGTGVAGIIAARGNNGTDLCGVCWRATIMAVKATDPDGLGWNSTVIEAVYYAIVNGADVISCSWGMNPPNQALYDVFQYAYSQGVVAVAGAGNDSSSAVFYPAGYSTVISVGATNEGDGRASWSNYGNWVDIMAPGTNMPLLSLTGGTWVAQGTSFSCPYVSGACALLLSINPSLTPAEVRDLIMNNGDRVVQGACKSNSRLNVFKAVSAMVSSTGTIHFDKAVYSPGSTVSVSLFDADLKETGTCDVTFTTDANDAETLTLTEDVPGTGVFHGSIATRLGVPEPNDGVLEVSDSDMITMMYRDAKGATRMYANRERLVEKTAVIDGRAPVISGVAVDASRPQPVITFETDEPALATIRCRPAGSPEPISQPPAGAIYAKRHSMVLYGLAAQTDYEFDIEASDGVGNVACDDNAGAFHAFTTIPDRGEIHVPADYPTIQEAIDHCWNGDTVLVADGTYTGPGNRDVEFKGKAITVRSENGPQSCILDCRGSEQDPHRGFYFHHRETEASVLDGFTVTGGYRQGDSSNGMVCRGGAILCNTSSPTIRNCVLRDSSAAYGGGLCVYGDSEVIIVGCVFTDNAATWGGGVFGNDGTILDLMDCTFTRNRADSYYGGFFCGYSNARATLTRCLFQENSATYGGGAVACGDSEVTIAQCRFVNNAVGGQSWCRGAGIMASNSEVVVVGSIFSGNKSDGYGAVFYNYTSRVSLTNCTFAGNAALDGRAVAFYGNAERTARLEATNCIVRDGGSEWFSEGDAPDIRIDYSNIEGGYPGQGNIDADPCFVNAGYWDRHEVRGAPTTEVWVDGDYHLLSQGGYWDPAAQTWIAAPVTSPCIDAGDPNDPVGSEPEPNGGRINMGAYGGTEEASRTPDPASG